MSLIKEQERAREQDDLSETGIHYYSDREQIENVLKENRISPEAARRGFEAAKQELTQLLAPLRQLSAFSRDHENPLQVIASIFADKLHQLVTRNPELMHGDIRKEDIVEVLLNSSIPEDIVWMMQIAEKHAVTDHQIEDEKVLIEERNENSTYVYFSLSPELLQLLLRSRSLGIYPFRLLDSLSDMNITVLGASAAQSFLLLLARLGAGTGAGSVQIIDPSITKPSTMAKGIGAPSFAHNMGRPKSEVVKESMQSLQPFGNYGASQMVVDLDSPNERTIQLLDEVDMVIEVVDDAKTKLKLPDYLAKLPREHVNKLLVRIADAGLDPYIEVLKTDSEQRFGRTLSAEEQMLIAAYLSGGLPPEAELLVHAVIANQYLSKGSDTLLGTLSSPTGSFSQVPSSGLEAASKGVAAILNFIKDGSETSSFASEIQPSFNAHDDRSRQILAIIYHALTNGTSSISFQ